jgi:hypothetical protein
MVLYRVCVFGCKQPMYEVQVVGRQQLAQAPKKNTLDMRGGKGSVGLGVKVPTPPKLRDWLPTLQSLCRFLRCCCFFRVLRT